MFLKVFFSSNIDNILHTVTDINIYIHMKNTEMFYLEVYMYHGCLYVYLTKNNKVFEIYI